MPLGNAFARLLTACYLAACLSACGNLVQANEKPGGYANREEAMKMAKDLEVSDGIPRETTLQLLSQADYLPKVVQLMKPAKTKSVKNWDNYRERFLDSYRINGGLDFWDAHETDLIDAQARFGIPAEVIVAIIGVETVYGRHTGKFRVIDSLATLGFDYPSGQRDRSDFFRRELAAFIRLCTNTHLECTSVQGSYAGAIGLGQFMPSSWQAYAVDGDNDGKVDLFGSERDAIFSVANFLKVHGWKTDHAARVPVEIRKTDHLKTLLEPDIKPTFTPGEMIKKGLELKRKTLDDEKLALIELVRGTGPSAYVVGGQNFYVVTRYNRSSFYANAVLELAETLKAKRYPSLCQANCN